MKSYEEWLQEIEFEIERLRLNSRHVYYAFSVEMTRSTATLLEKYFKEIGYTVQITVCPKKQWDLIIQW